MWEMGGGVFSCAVSMKLIDAYSNTSCNFLLFRL